MKTHHHIMPCQRASLWFAVKLLLLVAAFLLLAFLFPAFGQTNAPATTAALPAAPSPAALKVADDVRQLVVDLFVLGSGVSWSGAALAAYLAIKGVRNRTALGTGKFAPILNLLNLEAKSDFSQPQKPAVSDPPKV